MTPGSFMIYNSVSKILTFTPTLTSDYGNHTITINLTDGMDSIPYDFILEVIPPPPYFTTAPVAMSAKIGEKKTIALPSVMNPATGNSSGIIIGYKTASLLAVYNGSPFPGSITL